MPPPFESDRPRPDRPAPAGSEPFPLAGAFLWREVGGEQQVCLIRRAGRLELPRVLVGPDEGRRAAALRAARELCGWRTSARLFAGAALEAHGPRRLSTWYWSLEPTHAVEGFEGRDWVRWLTADEALTHVEGAETRELLLASRPPAADRGLGGRLAAWRRASPELEALAREVVRQRARLESLEGSTSRVPGGVEAHGRAHAALERAAAALRDGQEGLARVELEGARRFAAPLQSPTERALERVRLRQDVAHLTDREARARLEEVLARVGDPDAEGLARLRVEVDRVQDRERTDRDRRRARRASTTSLVAVELLALWLLGADPGTLPGALLLGALGGSACALLQDREDALRTTLLGALGGLAAQVLATADVLRAGRAGPLLLGLLAALPTSLRRERDGR